MALRKHGRVWCVYYKENGKRVERSTGCTSREQALFVERQIMNRRRIVRACKRLGIEAPESCRQATSVAGRVSLADMPAIAEKHRKVSYEAKIYWKSFCNGVGLDYADEVTPNACQQWLDREYGKSSPKTYNNAKTYCNNIFRACFGEVGVESPFACLLNRRLDATEHHRAYTDSELASILENCSPFWRFMVILSVNTGMAKETCLRFAPSWVVEIDGVKWARFTRAKTARFGRVCQVPLKQAVLDIVAPLNAEIHGDTPYSSAYSPTDNGIRLGFKAILAKAGVTDNADGTADFHSLRATFISRCREAGIAEHAIRSMVGHVASETTDVYSHDMKSPLAVLGV